MPNSAAALRSDLWILIFGMMTAVGSSSDGQIIVGRSLLRFFHSFWHGRRQYRIEPQWLCNLSSIAAPHDTRRSVRRVHRLEGRGRGFPPSVAPLTAFVFFQAFEIGLGFRNQGVIGVFVLCVMQGLVVHFLSPLVIAAL